MGNDELRAIFNEARSFDAYLASERANVDRIRDIYRQLEHVRFDPESAIFNAGTRLLILCETFCADCVLNLPLLARLSEASADAELRVASRNKHQTAAERFPGRGGLSRLPTVVLLDSDFDPIGYWSERSAADHEWMSSFIQKDPLPEITLEDTIPAGDFAPWLDRRLKGQLPIFLERNWKSVRGELKALAQRSRAAAQSFSSPISTLAG